MENATTLPKRGKTLLSGDGRTIASTDAAFVEGARADFDDIAPGQAPGAKVRRSNRRVTCILVRNVSGIALLPKRTVKWAAGYRGKRVDGYCSVTAEECAGVVDEHLPAAGVPNNDLFWIAVKGPSLTKTDLAGGANNSIAEGDVLAALTAATSQATTSGRVAPWTGLTSAAAGTTDGTQAKYLLNYLGRAMSAKTTAQTNQDILVDLAILK
ncbi:hypothetical protein [Planctomicrobium piriforme]|uniref:Uncharacterized protein n=1 Tax=Planctomicrobium piriforme TaxID=1576369 RepID=A0A1I3EE79_9PLAN|nr:hypothetical protein [Planctomicrobium piriforme]SFH96981.1 hypothetical protein SAMN05421753_104175 [Planctomicrobium piriforme]